MSVSKSGKNIPLRSPLRVVLLRKLCPPREVSAGKEVSPQQPSHGQEGALTVIAPVVGTFYRAPVPDSDPYVEVGTEVTKGQVICVIEAMKLMNEIEAESDGRISVILVENGQSVEYGQPLFLIEPTVTAK